jgi:hypothetical protein
MNGAARMNGAADMSQAAELPTPSRQYSGHNRISTQALTSLAKAAAAEEIGRATWRERGTTPA